MPADETGNFPLAVQQWMANPHGASETEASPTLPGIDGSTLALAGSAERMQMNGKVWFATGQTMGPDPIGFGYPFGRLPLRTLEKRTVKFAGRAGFAGCPRARRG